MRVLVTGAGNPVGRAIVSALLREGNQVRLFGGDASVLAAFEGQGAVSHFPGDLATAGSIEPALSERQVIVHAACCDEPQKDKHAYAIQVARGTLFARYGAEREQVDHFVHVEPAAPPSPTSRPRLKRRCAPSGEPSNGPSSRPRPPTRRPATSSPPSPPNPFWASSRGANRTPSRRSADPKAYVPGR